MTKRTRARLTHRKMNMQSFSHKWHWCLYLTSLSCPFPSQSLIISEAYSTLNPCQLVYHHKKSLTKLLKNRLQWIVCQVRLGQLALLSSKQIKIIALKRTNNSNCCHVRRSIVHALQAQRWFKAQSNLRAPWFNLIKSGTIKDRQVKWKRNDLTKRLPSLKSQSDSYA